MFGGETQAIIVSRYCRRHVVITVYAAQKAVGGHGGNAGCWRRQRWHVNRLLVNGVEGEMGCNNNTTTG